MSSSNHLDSLITLSPGFKAAVNLKMGLEDDRKVSGYIPTEAASEVLLDLGENLHPLASRRSRILTGTYGTGKSHLALVLARIYRDGVANPAITPVLDKMRKWPGKLQKLQEERSRLTGRFLLVLLEGDEGPFDDSLLRHLDEALLKEGLDDIFPETAFSAALARVNEIKQRDENALSSLEALARDFGFASVEALEGQLRNKQRSAYDRFCEIHKTLFVGAPFYHYHLTSPRDVYAAVCRRLIEDRGYAGIVVIWDEFGRYVERVMSDPRGAEGQSIQTFADGCCNGSGPYQVHLYLISHRSLKEYAAISSTTKLAATSKKDQEEWTKISGRFREFNMTSKDREVFDLMDQVILQNEHDPVWIELKRSSGDFFDECTDETVRLGLIPGFSREDIHSTVTLGTYPLHPMAAFCLPRISERVAQNERTLFTFLSDSGTDTLGSFLHRTAIPSPGQRPPFLFADQLWDFFAQDVRQHPSYKRVASKFDQVDIMVDPNDPLAKRIIKAIALLMVISSDHAPCTEQVIGFCLGLKLSEYALLREKLKALCTKIGNRDRILVQSVANGTYRFVGTTSDGFESKVDKVVEERMRIASPIEHLRSVCPELQIPTEIPATAYWDDFRLPRALSLEIVGSSEIESPERWTRNLGAGQFVDGYALIVICESGDEIRRARELATTTLNHPQILVGIPKEPLHVEALLRKHEAIRHLERVQANLYGKGADLREEWEHQDRDFLDAIGKSIVPLVDPEQRLLSWMANGREVANVGSVSRLRNVASDMMRSVFPLTPVIAHERLTTEEGKDSFVSSRRSIITKLLMRDGPELLAKETDARDRTVIDVVYRKNGILQVSGSDYALDEPDRAAYPATNAVWREVETAIQSSRTTPVPMSRLVAALRRPPYGMRVRSISLIVSAVLRKYVLRGNISFAYDKSHSSSIRITKIDGTVLDDAVISADKYHLIYTDIGQKQEAILFGVATAFNVPFSPDADRGELIERVHQSVTLWWRGLPPYAQQTTELGRRTLLMRDRILRSLAQEDADAQEILLKTVADAIYPSDQNDMISQEAVAELFSITKNDIDTAVEKTLVPKIQAIVHETFPSGDSAGQCAENTLADWYTHLPEERRDVRLGNDATILVRIARSVAVREKPASEGALELAQGITGTAIEHWGDGMLERFRGRLEGAKKAIEEVEVVRVPQPENGGGIVIPEPKSGQVHLVLSVQDEVIRRTFVPVPKISPMGENLRNIIRESLKGIGQALPSGECETILIEIIRDFLA